MNVSKTIHLLNFERKYVLVCSYLLNLNNEMLMKAEEANGRDFIAAACRLGDEAFLNYLLQHSNISIARKSNAWQLFGCYILLRSPPLTAESTTQVSHDQLLIHSPWNRTLLGTEFFFNQFYLE